MIKNIILCLLVVSLFGCTTADYRYTNYASSNFIAQNNRAVNSISKQLVDRNNKDMARVSPLVIATVVNMDDLNQTSSFGRLVTEQVSARFAQLNYNMVELKLGKAIMMKSDEGEFVLTRDVQDVVNAVNAKAVVVGTYAENSNDVYVNLKVVNPSNSVIIAAHSYAMPKAPNVADMLSEEMLIVR